MSWEDDLFALFDDLEQQADALYDAERAPELADRSRAEYQQVTLAGRLMASTDQCVQLGVLGVGPVRGELERVAAHWCHVRGNGQDWIVRLAAITTITGASERAVPEVAWSPVVKLGVGSALRRLGEAGERCLVHLLDGTVHEGTLARVGQDFAELVTAGERVQLFAFDALAAVQSRD